MENLNLVKRILKAHLMHRRDMYVRTSILLVCVLLCSSVFAFADDNDNTVQNEQPSITSLESVDTSMLRISASDTSGFHAVVLGVIGDYNSVVKDYTYTTTSYNGSQTTNHVVEITPDWSWIMSCGLFIVIIYCIFRFLGNLVNGGKL